MRTTTIYLSFLLVALAASDLVAQTGTIARYAPPSQAEQDANLGLIAYVPSSSEEKGIFSLFLDGAVRDAAEKDERVPTTGSLRGSYAAQKEVWSISLVLLAEEKAITADFGRSLLAPGSGEAISSGFLEYYRRLESNPRTGLHFYLSAANNKWQTETFSEDSSDTTLVETDATIIGGGALFYYTIVAQNPRDQKKNALVWNLEAGIAARYAGGDLKDNDEYRKIFLGTDASFFGGIELGTSIAVNSVTGSLRLYWLPLGSGGDHVSGLSDVQAVVALSAGASAIQFPIE